MFLEICQSGLPAEDYREALEVTASLAETTKTNPFQRNIEKTKILSTLGNKSPCILMENILNIIFLYEIYIKYSTMFILLYYTCIDIVQLIRLICTNISLYFLSIIPLRKVHKLLRMNFD